MFTPLNFVEYLYEWFLASTSVIVSFELIK